MGGGADEFFESVGQVLGDAGDVFSEASLSFDVERGLYYAVASLAFYVDGGGDYGGTGAQGQGGWSGGQLGGFAKEFYFYAGPAEVAITQQTDGFSAA